MEPEDVPIGQARLMNTPLVAWANLFKKTANRRNSETQTEEHVTPITYRDLYQGHYLRDVMHQINPRVAEDKMITRGSTLDESMERLQNWTILMKTIKLFYKDELQQVVTMKLPEILRIAKDPEDDETYNDIRLTLLLLLGCAIQCERKEYFIQQIINELSSDQQHAIKDYITELKEKTVEFTSSAITGNMDNVFSLETPLDSLGITGKALYYHLNRVIDERDQYIEEAAQATVDCEIYYNQLEELKAKSLGTPSSPEKHHIGVELAESKAKLRRLRIELEEKVDLTADMKSELEEHKTAIVKLREENKMLTQDARSARAYRDELDIVREKARKVEGLEKTIQDYKDKMYELDYHKSRVDELREENKSLIELKVMLEEQLSSSHRRNDTIIELENELMMKRKEIEEMSLAREREQDYIKEMQEYVYKLECDKNSTLNESANLEEELAQFKGFARNDLSQSLQDQLNDTSSSEIYKLELEIKRLHKVIEDMKEQAFIENSAHVLELEKENRRLASKVEKLQASATTAGQETMLMEQERQEHVRQVDELEKTLDTVKESSERQVTELTRENEQLTETIEALRKRNESSIDHRVKDVEKENKRMTEVVQERNQQMSKLEYELKNMQKQYNQLQTQSEEQAEKLEDDNTTLNTELQTLRLHVEKYEQVEQDLTDKDTELKKSQKQIDNLKSKLAQSEVISQSNITLTVDNQRLQKSLTASQSTVSRVADLEHDVEEKEKEVTSLKKTIEQLELDRTKLHDLEIKIYMSESENQKLTKQLELNTKKFDAKLNEYEELHEGTKKLEDTIEKLRLDKRKLERIGEENSSLEDSNSALNQEIENKEKEIKKLRQTLEVKETSIDEYSTKLSLLQSEGKQLKKSGEKWKAASMKVKDSEKEAADLMQQTKIDKKTISTLREELVQEKIRTHQLTNELEQLRSELHKIGLDQDKLQANASVDSGDRLKVLQEMLEDAHKKSLQIKDDKIIVLEQHLDESRALCATLHRQLETMQKEYQMYLDRRREEQNVASTTINVHPSPGKPSSSISQLVIKKTPQGQIVSNDQFVHVQNELITAQKRNSTLMSENAGLKSQALYDHERMKKLEEQANYHKTQMAVITGEKNSLHAQYAQLQVENTTLQSKSTSLHKQNSNLQTQLAKLQSTFDEIAISHQEQSEAYESLVADYEQLQSLNEQLSGEYEAIISEHGLLKTQYKQLKEDLCEFERSKQMLNQEKAAIEEMRQSLHKEKLTQRQDSTINEQYKRVNEDKQIIQQQTDKLRGEYRDLLSEYKTVKSEYNNMKLKHTELKGDMADCRDQMNKLDVQNAKLTNKCEALEHQNGKLEEENKQLLYQLQSLLQQNQELLGQTLESSEHFREEGDKYREQVTNLQRTKEKLEEKIMDQYRHTGKPKKKSGIGAIMKKAQGFISKEPDDVFRASPVSPITMRGSEDRLKDKGYARSQIDLMGNGSAEDNRSLSGLSIGSRGSRGSHGSGGMSGEQEGITLTKNNKVKLKRSRTKAQSIENIFDTSRAEVGHSANQMNSNNNSVQSHASTDEESRFNTTYNHQLTTDHRKIAVSTTALNVPMSMTPLREVSMTIPVDELANSKSGARSTENLLKSSSPADYRYRSADTRKISDSLQRGYSDEVPTKDVGLRSDPNRTNSSANSMFYTPPSRTRAVPPLTADDSRSDSSGHSQTRVGADRNAHPNYNSPKPDLVIGTESSPRGLVYYDEQRPIGHGPSPPKYAEVKTPRSQPSNMYASLDSRLNSTPTSRSTNDFLRPSPNNRGIPTQSVRPLNSSQSMNGLRSKDRPDLSQSTSNIHRASNRENRENPRDGSQSAREENSAWYEYGCV